MKNRKWQKRIAENRVHYMECGWPNQQMKDYANTVQQEEKLFKGSKLSSTTVWKEKAFKIPKVGVNIGQVGET